MMKLNASICARHKNRLLLLFALMFLISPHLFSQKTKEEIVNNLYDSISSKALTWIINERIKGEGVKPILTNVHRLADFSTKLNEKKDNKLIYNTKGYIQVKKYIKTLSTHKDSLLQKNDLSIIDFESLTRDSIYYNEILKLEEPEFKKKSQELKLYVEDQIKNAFTEYDITQNKVKTTPQTKADFNAINATDEPIESSSFFNAKLLLVITLIISIILNILQFILRKKHKKSRSSQYKVREKPINNDYANEFKPRKISPEKVNQIINLEYQNLKKEFIQKYNSDCFENENLKFEALNDQTTDSASNKTFKVESEVLFFLKDIIRSHKTIIDEELKNCVSREIAIQKISSHLKPEDFLNESNSNYITTNEVFLKIEQIKNELSTGLPKTLTINQLEDETNQIKVNIETFIYKKVKSSLELFMPFADTRGAISDDKKSSSPNRSSAIKLNINPNDNTEATFQLLYDKSEMIQPAIVSYDTILLPICNLKNEDFNRSGNRIEQIGQDGKMRLEDGFWTVTEKLNIKII